MDGNELRALRHSLELSQKAFAEALGVTEGTLARQERGELGIGEPMARLARILGGEATRRTYLKGPYVAVARGDQSTGQRRG